MANKVTAEFIGTAFLVATVVGSGIMASRLSPDDTGLQLLQNAIATGAILTALILMLQPISASFNPVITALDVAFGNLGARDALTLISAQIAGGLAGAMTANVMFDLDPVAWASTERSGGHLWFSEVIATLGLALVIFVTIRAGRSSAVAYTVGLYITAAYWFTSSTSFANPAVTIARTISDTFAGIAPASAPMFLLMQIIGGLVALVATKVLILTREVSDV